ncbi:STAS domain-containing protein [Paenibacillus wulumuqiensis]|uniref:STAS domain-containing protein n=1 Tax=Paenibacillus wulumuqiensis TaxID=1567107 RepID=UPI0006196B3F|nr:STAS domain-containing protein [Paenibacillus wulumuqiensis]
MFSYRLELTGEEIVVYCEGDIDIDAGDTFEEELEPELAKAAVVILNLESVQFVDSSGIGLLIKLVQNLQEQERQVWIEKTQPEVMEVFELLQLDEILGKSIFR